MATKIVNWKDSKGREWSTEHYALTEDLEIAYRESDNRITPPVIAAIDALHEYAHRNDPPVEAPKADASSPLFRHCGVEPGDDWAKRLERVNQQLDETRRVLDTTEDALDTANQSNLPFPAPTLDEVKALREGDEVLISGSWFAVVERHAAFAITSVEFVRDNRTMFFDRELAAICQGIRRRG